MSSKTARNPQKKPFGYAHFPNGTVCEVKYRGKPQVVTVVGIMCNAPMSFMIDAIAHDPAVGRIKTNIDHVTRIIQRGNGVATFPTNIDALRDAHDESVAASQKIQVQTKPKSSYLTFDANTLVRIVADDYVQKEMMVDFDSLLEMLRHRGMLKVSKFSAEEERNAVVVRKDKLRRAIRQLINKCLVNQRRAAEEYQAEAMSDYAKDLKSSRFA